ncbi:PAS domain-containing protein [Flavobacterium sp.]|uniref:PAS domain-containing sensor histidine kinase n=1 Tax=Flavobacterium sp. TaxID=239 RepID=UPI0011FCE2C2|nr:PAS domain-containing protein [Flavobacterium sp.]RZJ69263.1 MAG: PAS domain S-box protein [Flavobacterium sp.]
MNNATHTSEISAHEQLLNSFENAPVGIAWISGPEFTFSKVNAFYATLTGRSADALVGKPLLQAIPELEGQGFESILSDVLTTGKPFIGHELPVNIFRDGKLDSLYVDHTYQPQLDAQGNVYGILAIVTDVTHRKNAGLKVEDSEQKLRGIIASAPAGIGLFVGRDLIIESPNQTFIDIVGKGPNIVGLPLREAMPELVTEGQAYLKILDDVFTTGVPFISPASLVKITQNGVLNDNYYNISYTPLYDSNGEIYAILDIAIDVTAQVAAQKALADSEAHLQILRDTVPAMIFYLDAERRYLTYNVVFREWFGIGETEALGRKVEDFIGDAAYAKVRPHLDIAYAGSSEQYEMYSPTRMGVPRWLSIVYTPHKADDGSVKGVIVHATDITQSKLAEFALIESQSRFQNLLRDATVGMVVLLGEEMRVAIVNEAYCKIIGHSVADTLHKPLFEVIPGAEEYFLPILLKVLSTGEDFALNESPYKIVSESGQPLEGFVNFTYKPYRESDGKISGVMAVVTDVTEQVVARQLVEQKENELRNAIEIAELGTWTIDIASGKTSLSQRHADMFGLDKTLLSTAEAFNVIADEDRIRVERAFVKAQQQGGYYEAEYRIVNQITGKTQIIHAIGQTQFDIHGNPVRISGTARDITIQKELQTALENEVEKRTIALGNALDELKSVNGELGKSNELLTRSNEELARYAYVASHDLQEPLRKIRMFTSRLQNSDAGLKDLQPTIDRISSSAERMSQLINDLLAFSRLLESEIAVNIVNLDEIINNVWVDFELAVEEKSAVLELGKLPQVQAVKLQMNQLFYNLISNSLKFTAVGVAPRISIISELASAEQVRQYVDFPLDAISYHHIVFRDNGIGFETEYSDQIFEIFKRLHGKEIYPGSGIGLALCKKIVSNHHGRLFAESEIGKGSTFHIFLPESQNP